LQCGSSTALMMKFEQFLYLHNNGTDVLLQELLLYLLQLVQALKFESAASEQRSSRSTTSAISYDDSGLTDFLIARGVQNPTLGNRLYWYLIVEVELELEDRVVAKMYGRVVFKFLNKILEVTDLPGSRHSH
jgi:phosphatidylinositol 3-kinase